MQCAEVLLEPNRGEECCLVEELLSNLQRADFDFPNFCEALRTGENCSQILYRRRDGAVMNAGSMRECFDLEVVGGDC